MASVERRLMTLTPCVARPVRRMSDAGGRMVRPERVITPHDVVVVGDALYGYERTGLLRHCIVLTPLPPRVIVRYSSMSVRLPKPFSDSTSISAFGRVRAIPCRPARRLRRGSCRARPCWYVPPSVRLSRRNGWLYLRAPPKNIALAGGELGLEKLVALLDDDCRHTALTGTRIFGQFGLLTIPCLVHINI